MGYLKLIKHQHDCDVFASVLNSDRLRAFVRDLPSDSYKRVMDQPGINSFIKKSDVQSKEIYLTLTSRLNAINEGEHIRLFLKSDPNNSLEKAKLLLANSKEESAHRQINVCTHKKYLLEAQAEYFKDQIQHSIPEQGPIQDWAPSIGNIGILTAEEVAGYVPCFCWGSDLFLLFFIFFNTYYNDIKK